MSNIKFNFLTPIKKVEYNSKRRGWKWLFKCDCGVEKVIDYSLVKCGRTKSCGCFKAKNLKHGSGPLHNNWKSKTEISSTYFRSIIQRAKLRKIDFKITEEYAFEIFKNQNGSCALSGLKLSLNTKEFTASIDRIESNIGYIEGNIQWLHKDVNYMKYNLDQHEFINLCNKIKEKHEKK
jgi:hypothetical protein